LILSRLALNGWIEVRGEMHQTEVRLTEAGQKAMRARI
jgi:DNA-binding PadR family transcriptional regulator